jgi:hypothetical protein
MCPLGARWSRAVRNVRTRVQHAPRIPPWGVLFHGPPDKRGTRVQRLMRTEQAYETRSIKFAYTASSPSARTYKVTAGSPRQGATAAAEFIDRLRTKRDGSECPLPTQLRTFGRRAKPQL